MTASNDSSFPSEGRAIFTVELIKGKINEAVVVTRRTTLLLAPLPTGSFIISQFNLFTENSSSSGRHSLSNFFASKISSLSPYEGERDKG
jgi:hypothetical protein